MTAEALCPMCGKTVWISVKDIQTASKRAWCEECLEAEEQGDDE